MLGVGNGFTFYYSRNECMYQRKLVLIIIIFFLCCPTAEAKKRCKPLLKKLHNIQALQRSGHSAKQGQSLRGREDKARTNWWQCENGTSKKKKKSKRKTKKKSVSKTTSNNTRSTRKKSQEIKAGTPFNTTNAIVIKSKYQGKKKQAWLKYYQQPSKCLQAKKLSVFAFCSENKRSQRIDFEKQYNE